MVLRRDRIIVLAGLISVAALAWAYTVYLAHDMGNMHMGMGMGMAMPKMQSWSLMDFVSMFLMWAVMMVAMMVPTAAPMILIFANVNRKRQEQERPYVPTAVFLSGYLLVWTGFSVLATLAQWGLHEAALLSPMMVSTSPILGGILLLAAGIFQWTPLKYACLKHCRSPLSFLMTDWREGYRGALIMGLRHGGYCTGCCWFLMALLFVAGVMNLLWVATITAFVLVEKAVPRGDLVGRIAGVALCIAGLIMLVQVWS
jgi:predicted metal-binding membrane protein